ncbi:phospholipase D family protein [Arenibacter certesii]|uniref:Phospholipase D-like domain-containing protein n=1 Tax=Arenibacter certesii TaxID=228955 RepID=A0A918J528_9FLAO|nr:phospholipase D family protein [Arenibacter certesii]GGW48794.1 hypothetical protein GCM10007383_36050 [Arenibacter certesii]
MSKVVATRAISYYIEKVITEAKRNITLVTPYIKIAKPLYDRLVVADNNGINITIVYGKVEMNREQADQLMKLKHCRILFVDNLHAKVYINENFGVITSMNLYDYSEINNFELGAIIDKNDNLDIYNSTIHEIEYIIKDAKVKKEPFQVSEEEKDNLKIETFINQDQEFTIKNFPLEGIEISKRYGFITYNFHPLQESYIKSNKSNIKRYQEDFGENYRVYCSFPYDKISIYENTKLNFDTEKEKKEYYINGIKRMNKFIKDYVK